MHPIVHSLRMATYTIAPRIRQAGYKIEMIADNGARHTILEFKTEADAEAWIAEKERVALPIKQAD